MGKAEQIRDRLEYRGLRYWAGDNISQVLQEGDKEELIDSILEQQLKFDQTVTLS